MKEIINRLSSDTPEFFQRLFYIVITLAGVAGTLIGLHKAGQLELSAGILKILQHIAAAGLVAGAIAKTTIKDAKVKGN